MTQAWRCPGASVMASAWNWVVGIAEAGRVCCSSHLAGPFLFFPFPGFRVSSKEANLAPRPAIGTSALLARAASHEGSGLDRK